MKSYLFFMLLSVYFSAAFAQSRASKEETIACITRELITNAHYKMFSIDSTDHYLLYYHGSIGNEEITETIHNGTLFTHKVNFGNVTGYQFQDDRKRKKLPEKMRRLYLYIYLQNDTMPILFNDATSLATQKKLSVALDRLVELNIRETFNYP